MKNYIAIIILLCAGTLFSQSHNLQQQVKNWPANCDTAGMHWYVYNLLEPKTKVLDNTSVGSATNFVPASNLIVWNANLGNFPGSPPWSAGDSIIAFGSWDSTYANDPIYYGFNQNHTGFYWVFSDTLTTEEPQVLQPDDTLRPLPRPLASLQFITPGVDIIIIKIPNPKETRRIDQNAYDVLGYELYASEHIGTPNNLTRYVGYIPCQGVYGDTTIYKDIESNYLCETIYYAYKIVVRPDTTLGRSSERGYTSTYFSMNSDAVDLNWAATAPGYMNTYLSRNSSAVSISWVTALELTGFEAVPIVSAIVLRWTFASSDNIIQYIIKKSTSKKFNYLEIARIPGSGSSPSPKSYSYKDEDVKKGKRYYYRLGVVKENGSTKWYGPVSAVITGIKPSLIVSPNPFTQKTVIRYSSIVNSKDSHLKPCFLRIYDVSGRLVKRFTIHDSRFTDVTWNGRDDNGKMLPSGIYYCRFSTEIKTKIEKILFIK